MARVSPTGSVPAGTAADAMPSLQAGQCAGIATGAVLPPGADAVVMIEDVEFDADGKSIHLREGRQWPTKPGHDVRAPGSDLEADKVLVEQGNILQPADVALFAMAGVDPKSVPLVPRLPVFVLSTGTIRALFVIGWLQWKEGGLVIECPACHRVEIDHFAKASRRMTCLLHLASPSLWVYG